MIENRNELPKLITTSSPKVIEVGVKKGNYAKCYMKQLPKGEFWFVDNWDFKPHFYQPECAKIRRKYEIRRKIALTLLGALTNCHIIPCDSIEAAEFFPNKFFDWIYIDTTHKFLRIKDEVLAWWPKLKFGGMFSGHDYDPDLTLPSNKKLNVKDVIDGFFGNRFSLTNEQFCKSWHLVKEDETLNFNSL